ncbi:sugar phosphate isomerase/epimerase [Chelatococcus sp. SYSU_G07232]|uniref:Sugar phosphate isomerase/epimerase n=1 Tax=Chelatococcus albus TaxID=3047466 RepID=A0ABT7AFB4_9HYPH|nr:sugar phosphate isomerase/epimerase [Chelatococcus sp. SYSU_G07232]MDJ1158061.1 sugar phosphate isomerase/epimerase [Chelatococcus sp. SYSU_G07232]
MTRLFSLSHLTVLDFTPPDLIRLAADAGFDAVGIRLAPATVSEPIYDVTKDARLRAATLAALNDTGLRVLDVEILRLVPAFSARDCEALLAVAQMLGARHVLVAGNDPDAARAAEHLAELAAFAGAFDLTIDLEPMPWTDVPDVATAGRIVEGAGAANAGVLVDALHFDRAGSTVADLAAIPAARCHYMQLCDAPAERPASIEAMLHTARAERLPPGEGGLDLRAILRALPPEIPVSLEIPQVDKASTTAAIDRVRHDLALARAVVAAADGGP